MAIAAEALEAGAGGGAVAGARSAGGQARTRQAIIGQARAQRVDPNPFLRQAGLDEEPAPAPAARKPKASASSKPSPTSSSSPGLLSSAASASAAHLTPPARSVGGAGKALGALAAGVVVLELLSWWTGQPFGFFTGRNPQTGQPLPSPLAGITAAVGTPGDGKNPYKPLFASTTPATTQSSTATPAAQLATAKASPIPQLQGVI